MKQILKNRNFMTLFTGQLIEQFGDSLTLMSLIAWAMSMKEAGSSSLNMSILMFWIGLPIILLGPVAGVIVDRMSRKTVLISAALMRGILIFLIYMIISDYSRAPYVFGLVFFTSVVSQFFIPAKSSIIPSLVNDKELLQANSLSATFAVIVQILTYAIGGVVISEIGHRQSLLINVFVYAAVAIVLFFVKPGEKIKDSGKAGIGEVLGEIKEGLVFLFKNPRVMFVVRRVALLMIAIGLFYVSLTGSFIGFILQKSGIQMKEIKALGFMQSFLGIGLVTGMLMTQGVLKWMKEQTLVRFLFPVLGLLLCALYFYPDFYFLLFVSVAAGIAGVMVISIAETSIQKNTPESLRGRIFASYYILRGGGLAAATSACGLLAKVITEAQIVLITGSVLFIYGIITYIMALLRKDNK